MIAKLLTSDAENRDIIVARGREVIGIEVEAQIRLEQGLDDDFAAACETIYGTRRQLAVTGMVKTGHIDAVAKGWAPAAPVGNPAA